MMISTIVIGMIGLMMGTVLAGQFWSEGMERARQQAIALRSASHNRKDETHMSERVRSEAVVWTKHATQKVAYHAARNPDGVLPEDLDTILSIVRNPKNHVDKNTPYTDALRIATRNYGTVQELSEKYSTIRRKGPRQQPNTSGIPLHNALNSLYRAYTTIRTRGTR